jgi:hypothetical protein
MLNGRYIPFSNRGDFETYGFAAEYVCLPHNPDFNLAEKSTHKNRAYMYGSEYQDNLFERPLYSFFQPLIQTDFPGIMRILFARFDMQTAHGTSLS